MRTSTEFSIRRGDHRLNADLVDGPGVPVLLMHGFPDNLHLYDRLVPFMAGQRRVIRFDFLGWGRSDKPAGHAYTTASLTADLEAVIEHLGADRVSLVAHDASGPPAIDWALAHPDRVERLVLLNTYYHWIPQLRRPPAIALYSTPGVRTVARALVRRFPEVDRRLYAWQVGRFIQDPELRAEIVPMLYSQFGPARPAFWRLNDELMSTVIRRRSRVRDMRRFDRPVQIIFGGRDRYLNPRVAKDLADTFPRSDLHLIDGAGHYVQIDRPDEVARLILDR